MTVCIDTNSLIQLFGRKSRSRAIAVALMDGRIESAVSTAILLEYEEVAAELYGPVFAQEVATAHLGGVPGESGSFDQERTGTVEATAIRPAGLAQAGLKLLRFAHQRAALPGVTSIEDPTPLAPAHPVLRK
jgi:hypothetical protein